MTRGSPIAQQQAVRVLRVELHQADDEKIRRVAAMLDHVSDATGKQAILDPLRPRLRQLKTVRPLRFTRLLFTPFEPLIVTARAWKPGEATVPRNALGALALLVRTSLEPDVAQIDATIAGQASDTMQVITRAGAVLWPRAGEILAACTAPPPDWQRTGVRDALFLPLVHAMATVLRCGPQLRDLQRDADVAALAANETAIRAIIETLADQPPEGCVMVAQLILLQSPAAAPLLRQFIASLTDTAQRVRLNKAMADGTERALTQMESQAGIVEGVGRAPLAEIGDQVRRITRLLREIGQESGGQAHRPRLTAIRKKLDEVCRNRFSDGMTEGLVNPLTGGRGEIDRAGQTRMETCARDLRRLETAVRTVGGSGHYDDLLHKVSETVQTAAASGTLTPVRTFRLIEILTGPEAATALYREDKRRT
jgi:hypothetical protein